MTVGVPLDLPQTDAQSISDPEEPLVVSVQRDGRLYVQETEVAIDNLGAAADRGDRRQSGGDDLRPRRPGTGLWPVMEVLGRVSAAGFTRVSLVAEQPAAAQYAAEPPFKQAEPSSPCRSASPSRSRCTP